MEPTDDSLPLSELPKNLSLQLWRLMGEDVAAPSPSAVRLAAALAERLAAVIPAPFRVQAEGGWVSGYEDDRWDCSSDVAGVLDQDLSATREDGWEPEEWPFVDRVVSISYNVLSSVQDMIAETTTEPWPRLPGGGMANPGSRADATRLYLWYGPDEKSEEGAVLLLTPVDLAALERGQCRRVAPRGED